jgi:lysophospholipid acyltransferase (LPLAT)-like uncharacterized protein
MTRRLALVFGPALGSLAVRVLALTLSIRREEDAVRSYWRSGAPIIYTSWHGRTLLMPLLYGWLKARVLASRSEDGELAARFIARFGLAVIRGSSSRGGAEALRALARLLTEGTGVFVVPDGPKGPREVVKPGIVMLARLSGAPIVPMAFGASREWRLRSWDEFRIPKPFARCVMRFGEPIRIPRQLDRAGEEAARKEVENALHALTSQVDQEARA